MARCAAKRSRTTLVAAGRLSVVLRLFTSGAVIALTTASVALATSGSAGAATQTVTNCNDSGTGSLRQAVLDSASGDTVSFSPSLPCATITLGSTIDISTSLSID